MSAPRTVDLRIDAGWIIPVEPAGVLTGHALIVDKGRIVALLPADAADAAFAPRTTHRRPAHALIPGLVNAHTHAAMTLMRGVADDLPLKAWLEEHIWPLEARFVSPDFVYDGTLLGAAEMLRGGVTCCNDMYFYPDAAARAYETAGIARDVGRSGARLPDALCRRRRRVPAERAGGAGRVQALVAGDVFAGAACAVYGRRRHVGKDRHVCAGARLAHPDASRRNAPGSGRSPCRNGNDSARSPRSAGRHRARPSSPSMRCTSSLRTWSCSLRSAAMSSTARGRT